MTGAMFLLILKKKKWQLAILRLKEDGTSDGDVFHINQAFPGDHDTEADPPIIDHMYLDSTSQPGQEWLYGTTRSHKYSDKNGDFVYFWKVRLDPSTHDPDPSTVICVRHTAGGVMKDRGYVTGLKQTLEANGNVHGTFRTDGKDLFYFIFNWTNDVQKAAQILQDFDVPGNFRVVFIGANRQVTSGPSKLDRYQGYIGAQTKSVFAQKGKVSFKQDAPAIWSLLDNQNCIIPSTKEVDVKFDPPTNNTSVRKKPWRPNTLTGKAQILQPIFSWDIPGNIIYETDSWCQFNKPTIQTVVAGAAQSGMCSFWDDIYRSRTFTPNTVTTPNTCTDAVPTWIYSIDQTSINAVRDYLKVSIDSVNGLIWVKGIPGLTIQATYTLTIIGYLPTGQSAQFPFLITMSPCATTPIIPSILIDQTYYVNYPTGFYDAPPFTVNASCSQPMVYTNTVSTNNFISNSAGTGKYLSWQTNDDLNIRQYVISITATISFAANSICATATNSYMLDVRSVCEVQQLQIDPTNAVFKSPAIVQNVWDVFGQLTWGDSQVVEQYPGHNCSPYVFQLVTQADTAIDTTLFKLDSSVDTRSLQVQTNNSAKVGSYLLRIKVVFVNYPQNPGAFKDFKIEVIDSCETAYTITPSAPPATVSYTVARPALITPAMSPFTVVPNYCPIKYSFTVIPAFATIDISTITFDALNLVYTIQTSKNALAGVYTMFTQSFTPLGVDTGKFNAFNVTIIDPCIAATLTINPAIFPTPFEYIVTKTAITKTFFDSDVTSTETLATCPDIVFSLVNRDLSAYDITVFTFDASAQSLTTFSSSQAKIGLYKLTLQSRYSGTSYLLAGKLDFDVMLIDPCLNSAIITAASQTNPPDYAYTGTNPLAVFSLNPFLISPSFCVSTHSCFVVLGTPNMCSITGTSTASFSTITGNYLFNSTDMATYVPGVYRFKITATVGSQTNFITFDLKLVDPCSSATITLTTSPFVDESKVLGAGETTQAYSLSSLYNINTMVDCGAFDLQFYLMDGSNTPLNTAIFEDRRTPSSLFARKFVTNYSYVGVYKITYRIFLVQYPSTSTEQITPFTVTILMSCPQPTTFTPSVMNDQEYTITGAGKSYNFPAFTIDPINCAIVYTYSITESATGNIVVASFDGPKRLFEFFHKENLDPLENPLNKFKDYEVTVTGTSGLVTPRIVAATFTLKVKNPCHDPSYISITTSPLPAGPLNYTLYYGSLASPIQIASHTPYLVTTTPIVHTLCGSITYAATFRGKVADFTTLPPVAYDLGINNTFKIYSENLTLIGMNEVTVSAKLTKYPFIITATTQSTQIQIIDPCIDPQDIFAPIQTNPLPYKYDGATLTYTLAPYKVFPAVCKIVYSCAITASSPQTNLCNILLGSTSAAFNSNTGEYTFQSIDNINFPPGSYTFQITGTSGLKSIMRTWVLTLLDPCSPPGAFTLKTNPFKDEYYVLRNPQIDRPWAIGDLVNVITPANCGSFTVKFFYNDQQQTALDTALFKDQRNASENIFQVLYTEDVTKTGVYKISYKVLYTDFSTNFIVQTVPFTVTVIDPCDKPTSVTASDLANQFYTITQNAIVYKIPVFIASPSWCAITYSYTITNSAGAAAIDSWDPTTQTFTFKKLDDLSLSGPSATNYTVKVTGTAGITQLVSGSTNFILQLKNPCIDPAFLRIQTNPLPTGMKYILYSYSLVPYYTFSHTAFTITTLPFQHVLCGDLNYTVKLDGVRINELSLPMSQTSASNTFAIYSEDYAYLGLHEITVTATLTNYSTVSSGGPLQTQILIIDPCLDPFFFTAPVQTNPPAYLYTFDSPKLVFDTVQFPITPAVCAANTTYSCQITSGSRTDLCQITSGSTVSTFNPITGGYTFQSFDMINFTPGTYVMKITGKSGAKSQFFTINLVLVDPCPTVNLGLQPSPFTNATYVLFDPAMQQPWKAENLISPQTKVDCGPISVEFFNNNEQKSAINTALFQDNRTAAPNNIFCTLFNDNPLNTGSYPFRYRVFHTKYFMNMVEQPQPFTITIIRSCINPQNITASALTNQQYTITDNTSTYQVPIFTYVPDFCDVVYSFTVNDLIAQNAITFDANQFERKFSFFNDNNLLLSGLTKTEYIVVVKGVIGSLNTLQATASFVLTLSNPCIDSKFVTIEKVAALPAGLEYVLWDFDDVLGYTFTHAPFTVKTKPLVGHSLCGNVQYHVYFENTPVTSSSRPLKYDTVKRIFDFYSENILLKGFRNITIQGYFEKYDTVTSLAPNFETEIKIYEPCYKPASLSDPGQTNPPEYFYTEEGSVFNMKAFVLDPPVCDVTYECVSVTGNNNSINCNDPATVNFNPKTGNFIFTAFDKQKHPPGKYKFSIRGKAGTAFPVLKEVEITLTLSDPCFMAKPLTINQFPFFDMRYTLGYDTIAYPFDELFTFERRFNCGILLLEFIDEKGNPLNPAIFSVPASSAEQRIFKILQQDNKATVGEYKIRYRATLKDYPGVTPIVLTQPFAVTILEPPNPSTYVFNIMPDWLKKLKDQYMQVGESKIYKFGDNVNFFGGKSDLKVNIGRAFMFSSYDAFFNAYVVNGDKVTDEDIGMYKIIVEATYIDPKGTKQFFSNSFYLHIYGDPLKKKKSDQGVDDLRKIISANDFKGLVMFKPQPLNEDRPIPYILDFTPTGVMTIAWDRSMRPYEKPNEIPPTQIAVQADILFELDNKNLHMNRRMLEGDSDKRVTPEEVWFKEGKKQQYQRMLILDALEVRMMQESDSDRISENVEHFSWTVIDFDRDHIWLQISYDNPEKIGTFESKDYITVTFWGVEFFKSFQNVEVEFGTKLRWRILRQLSQDDGNRIDSAERSLNTLIIMGLVPVLLFTGLGGRLLPTWMFLNSMQLMVHTPLLSTYMPANIHYFLVDYLSLLRLSSKRIGDLVETWQRKRGFANYQLIVNENSQYSQFLNMAGYKHSFFRNLIIFTFFAIILLLVIACLYIWSCIALRRINQTKKALSKTLEGGEEADKTVHVAKWYHSKHGALSLNFSLRFVYEFFLEICICVFIHLTVTRVDANEAEFLWVLSLIVCFSIVFLVLFTIYLFFQGGPYTVPNSYEKNSLWHSWWSVRSLRPEESNDSQLNQKTQQQKIPDEEKHQVTPEEEEKVQQDKIASSVEGDSNRMLLRRSSLQSVFIGKKKSVKSINTSFVFDEKKVFNESGVLSTPLNNNRIIRRPFTQSFPGNRAYDQRFFAHHPQDDEESYEGGAPVGFREKNFEGENDFQNGSQKMIRMSEKTEHKRKIKLEAERRVQLQSQVQLSNSYKTLFYGLKKNDPHNVAIVQPLSFMLRRIIYAMVIVLTTEQNSFFAALILLLTCMFMMAFVLVEAQWEETLINVQHFVNEIFFYILCCFLMLFSGITEDSHQLLYLGWLTMIAVCSMIIFNMIVIIYDIFAHIKLLCKRYKHQLVPKKQKKQVRYLMNRVKTYYIRCCTSIPRSLTKKSDQIINSERKDTVRDNQVVSENFNPKFQSDNRLFEKLPNILLEKSRSKSNVGFVMQFTSPIRTKKDNSKYSI